MSVVAATHWLDIRSMFDPQQWHQLLTPRTRCSPSFEPKAVSSESIPQYLGQTVSDKLELCPLVRAADRAGHLFPIAIKAF